MKITDKAREKIKEIADEEGIENTSVRVSCKGGGCAGVIFNLEFDDKPGELDEETEVNEIKVIIDPLSFPYVEEATMDYEEGMMGGGFRFSSGKLSGACGCGNSYEFKEPEKEKENKDK